ncbi:MAG: D-tyrosyl-tRNA(Tyr) deacylase [Spirochaetia bacterium]|nr:D-tyrosyl-tRNA(Tyr) deacylase [Spirochaetia bacterium]
MRALIQRVTSARVDVDGQTIASIGQGILILLGVGRLDTESDADRLAAKCASLRIFEDADGKMNLSLTDVSGAALVVSQFTLYADTRKGNRPSFTDAGEPDTAVPLYTRFLETLGSHVPVQAGRFGADMKVHLTNDGPVTILIESENRKTI